MEKRVLNTVRESQTEKEKIIPKYESPRIITYTNDDILEQIGPAQACSPNVSTGTGSF